ncbi:MAG: transcription-repair coupling factor [Magnetovibrio sp.]|nr:transcription-repair coupling factor [Magnetovibrio sp.]
MVSPPPSPLGTVDEAGLRSLIATGSAHVTMVGVPIGAEAGVLADLSKLGTDVVFVARDDVAMERAHAVMRFMAPEVRCVTLPAWDCLPYDRVSPRPEIIGARLAALMALLDGNRTRGTVVLTTVSAALQRLMPRARLADTIRRLDVGGRIEPTDLNTVLMENGFRRAETVREMGEYAVRGDIVDIFPSGALQPFRLDFFSDELEAIRTFDPISQRTIKTDVAAPTSVTFSAVGEVVLNKDTISRFRSGYRVAFGVGGGDDPLYAAVSEGQRHTGMEHWQALFFERLESLFDYLPTATVVLDHHHDEVAEARFDLIMEYYRARCDMPREHLGGGAPYRPIPPDRLYFDEKTWRAALAKHPTLQLSPYGQPAQAEGTLDLGGKPGEGFADVRVDPNANVFSAVGERLAIHVAAGRRVLITAHSEGSADRLATLLAEHDVEPIVFVSDWSEFQALPNTSIGLAILPLESGLVFFDKAIITEQDILGDRLNRPARRRLKAENFLTETTSLSDGDLIVHMDHGVAKFDGLVTIEVGGAPHDCLRLLYAGDDKLFLPVENIEMLTRYGSEGAGLQLDRLGGANWQARKARLKERIREMADELISVAAARSLRTSPKIPVPAGIYEEFCARFPFTETDDQARAIASVLDDLGSGQPADRLICGDVGFGKTEVALRAAFATAYDGKQVAIVVPTTLLCRQHFQNFVQRFAGFPMRIEQVSRLVSTGHIRAVKEGLKDGSVDIVIGTHALLAKDVEFRELGLLIIDEEQHFGVAHKERLKKLRSDVHVLTLTATPIPRTLQLALTGIREMSLIATPPVDRLAVRTFVLPFDPMVIREALLREKYRGGQSYYVCPRIAYIPQLEEILSELVPELNFGVAHGRMATRDLEAAIAAFDEGNFDVLLSTNIIESGLDMPSVNTIIIHRSDMFGLGQLYQLRGRVGRSKIRAYAYLTLPPNQRLTQTAERRLEVMQTLDSLGAGFSLASHDLDIRGAGNLLGEEQSGHIREVGAELYQQMLEEAVAEARNLQGDTGVDSEWSPQINIGLPVLIPDSYVEDLGVRMGLYRRLAHLTTREEIDVFAAELIDRFGTLPKEAENLLQVVTLKGRCKEAGVEKVDAGPKGAVVGFRNDDFTNPAGLVEFLSQQAGTAKLRPDHKLVYMRQWNTPEDRLDGVRYLVGELAKMVTA